MLLLTFAAILCSGEPNGAGGWPKVSCSFGQFDIAGFPKPHAWWYALSWGKFCGDDKTTEHCSNHEGVPLLSNASVAHILDLLDFPLSSGPDRAAVAKPVVLSAVASTHSAELFLDGVSQGEQKVPAYHNQVHKDLLPVLWIP